MNTHLGTGLPNIAVSDNAYEIEKISVCTKKQPTRRNREGGRDEGEGRREGRRKSVACRCDVEERGRMNATYP